MKKVIVTFGPALYKGGKLKRIHKSNYIYRVNAIHADSEDVEKYIDFIRAHVPGADILVDLPGNKIRITGLKEPIRLEVGTQFSLKKHQINYPHFYEAIKKGAAVLADDGTLRFTVEDITKDKIIFRSESKGFLRNGKGLHGQGIYTHMPFLLPKDKDLITLANEKKVRYIGLSFVRTASDIAVAREAILEDISIIAKVETKSALENIDGILDCVDFILIDRGDLASDVGLKKIPFYQKFIVEKAIFYNKKVFLATQFLKNMEHKPVPTIAEVIDLYNTLKLGIFGIQLSEETAVGEYPERCLNVISVLMEEIKYENFSKAHSAKGGHLN